MDWSIRVADAADAPAIARLNGVVQGLHHDHHPAWFKPPDAAAFLPTVEGWFRSPEARVFLAEDGDGQPIGYVSALRRVRPTDALRHGAVTVELDQVVVVPAARGQGVGRALCTSVIDWARVEGASLVELGTWAFNDTAYRVFEGLGFRPTVRRMAMTITERVDGGVEHEEAGEVAALPSPGLFDETIAPTYDQRHAERFADHDLGPTLDFLTDLARPADPARSADSAQPAAPARSADSAQPAAPAQPGGRALEFASGTGRVALPLAARGVEVHGIELSPPMVEQMRAKPGADRVDVTIGDMATARIPGRFDVVYLVYNTIGNLLTQSKQVACFANAAAHLRPGGCFVIETFVPELRRLPPGQHLIPFALDGGYIGVDEYDVVDQRLVSHHHRADGEGRWSTFRTPQRYTWPAELDLMARLAGLRLRERWATWDRQPFTPDSTTHISVWEKP